MKRSSPLLICAALTAAVGFSLNLMPASSQEAPGTPLTGGPAREVSRVQKSSRETLANGTEVFTSACLSEPILVESDRSRARVVSYSLVFRHPDETTSRICGIEVVGISDTRILSTTLERRNPDNSADAGNFRFDVAVKPRGTLRWGEVRGMGDIEVNVTER